MSKAFIAVFAMIALTANGSSMNWTQKSRSVTGVNITMNDARTVASIINPPQKYCLASALPPVGLRPPYIRALAKHILNR